MTVFAPATWNVRLRRSWPDLVALAMTVGAFGVYFAFRQTEIGGTDEWAYFSQAKWFLGRDAISTGGLDPVRFPAILPHFWDRGASSSVPFFPPGFPLLLAAADLLGLLLAVPALVGAGTVWLAYLLARREVGGALAVLLALAWATMPIVAWGSTHLMSDLPAAACTLGAYYLLVRARPAWAGVVTAFSILVRPSNLAFAFVIAAFGARRESRLRFAIASAAGVAMLVAIFFRRYGALSRIEYFHADIARLGAPLTGQLVFLVRETFRCAWPLVLLSVVAVARSPVRAVVPCIWFLSFLFPYSMEPSPYDDWWWVRYMLPAFPALLVLGAVGLHELSALSPLAIRIAAPLLALAPVAMCREDERLEALTMGNSGQWSACARVVEAHTPRDALVGTRRLAGALHVYARRASFQPFHPEATELVLYALDHHFPVYLVEDAGSARLGLSFAGWHRAFTLDPVADVTPTEHLFRVSTR